ncbi:MAG TPA: Trm112 family protein, partial [Thermoanaerobaculaceae bacterium]|nr:Trm112 family protein [Thermoanaerobaculaceae bacterium]
EAAMPVDPQLLEILVCPACKADVELVPLASETCTMLVERYREKFRDETPEVHEGLKCASCRRVYPIVSDIPVMLIDEALPAEG